MSKKIQITVPDQTRQPSRNDLADPYWDCPWLRPQAPAPSPKQEKKS
jgi:hypothetical protein